MAAGKTYKPIATTTLGSDQTSITFSTISGSYTDIVLIATTPSTQVAQNMKLELNSDTGTNYSLTTLGGTGSSTFSDRESTTATPSALYLGANSNAIMHFQNYSNTTTYKTVLIRSNAPSNNTIARVLLWRSTSAITSIKIKRESTDDIKSDSTFTLYGISAA
jgi:hypothetical protein